MTWKVFSLNPNYNICCTISSYKITQTNFSNSIFFRRKKKKERKKMKGKEGKEGARERERTKKEEEK